MKNKFGYMPCETCGERVMVKVNEKNTLSYGCDECDAAPYAKEGSGQHAHWVKKCAVEVKPAVEAPKVDDDPPPVVEKKATSSVNKLFGV